MADHLKWIESCAWRDAHRILELESEELQMWAKGLTHGPRYAQVQAQLEILREGPVNQGMLECARRMRANRQNRAARLAGQHPPIRYHWWNADGTVVVRGAFDRPNDDQAAYMRWRLHLAKTDQLSISDLPPLP